MIDQIISVEFPNASVRAAAAQNTDGSYNIYANTLLPEKERGEAVQNLIRRIEEGMAV